MIDQLTSFLSIHNVEADKALLDEDDFYIRPEVDNLSPTDFSTLDEAFSAGRNAAQQQLEQLAKLSVSSAEYLQYIQLKSAWLTTLIAAEDRPVVEIILSNQSSYNDQLLRKTLELETGVPITAEALLAALDRVYSLDSFETVYGAFEERDNGRVLVVEVVEKSWGPNYFEAGLGWEDDFTEDSVVDLNFAFTLGNITDNNGEWRNELSIGTKKGYLGELYLPLDSVQQFYQSTVYQYRLEDLDSFGDSPLTTSLDYTSHRLDLAFGYKLGNQAVVETGFTFENGNFDNDAAGQRRA